jgi:peptidoglycan/LPS O-acetylase OafA/YrhL
MSGSGREPIYPLTSLRFFAALMVVAHHYWGFEAGYSGVSFFYVLSGFVLTTNYRGKVGTWAERRSFWWKRVARIYPLHLLTLLLSVPIAFSKAGWQFNVVLLQSWVPDAQVYSSLNAPSWSISDEAFFYALFPALLGFLSFATLKRISIWLALFVLIAVSTALLFPQRLMDDPTHFFFYICPLARLIEFAFGIVIALRPLKSGAGLAGEFGALGLAAAGVALVYFDLPGSLSSSLIFWPGSVALVAVFSVSRGVLARLLSHPIIVMLGEASFALYMIHFPLGHYSPVPRSATAILAVILSVAIFRWFEKPVQRLLLGRIISRPFNVSEVPEVR